MIIIKYSNRFGRTSSGTIPETLQWIKMKTVTFEECVASMTKQNKDRIFETNVCAIPTDTAEGGGKMSNLILSTQLMFNLQLVWVIPVVLWYRMMAL